MRVAGIVTRVRPHQTKTGKSMGFVTLEDVQGNIELVVFPRTWDKYWEALEVDNVVLIDGKVDAQSGDPKVLVDSVTTDLKSFTSAETPPPVPPAPAVSTGGSILRVEAPILGARVPPSGLRPRQAPNPPPSPRTGVICPSLRITSIQNGMPWRSPPAVSWLNGV